MVAYRGRFAPSPPGELHIGAACTGLCAWLAARAARGTFVIRIEDIDTPRVVPGAAERILEDLRWLGLDWNEGPDCGGPYAPYVQSARTALYEQALQRLSGAGLTYGCDCSRAEIARLASAPHPGEQVPVYPGTCRTPDRGPRTFRRAPAIRLAVPSGPVRVADAVHGVIESDVACEVGDFVLQRGDGVFAYQLAVVVDDLAMQISEVVRAADLLSSAPRQALLATLLGREPPRYAHTPVIVAPDGSRLAKRDRGVSVRDHRDAGQDPRRIVAAIGRSLGLCDPQEDRIEARALVDRFCWATIPREPIALTLDLPH